MKHHRDHQRVARPPRAQLRLRAGAGIAAIVGAALIALSCGGGVGGGEQATLPTTQEGRLTRLLEDLAWAVVVPQYQAMTASFADLDGATAAFCDAPAAQTLETTRAAWRRAIETWVAASMFQQGPIGDDNRGLRIEFWPDANNNVARAVESSQTPRFTSARGFVDALKQVIVPDEAGSEVPVIVVYVEGDAADVAMELLADLGERVEGLTEPVLRLDHPTGDEGDPCEVLQRPRHTAPVVNGAERLE